MTSSLRAAFAAASPRVTPRPRRVAGVAIHAIVVAIFVAALACAFTAHTLWVWAAGIAYIVYDLVLLTITTIQTWPLWRGRPDEAARMSAARPTLGVLIAAHNEAAHLPATLQALLAQSDPAELILIADDGSDDDTAQMLATQYGVSGEPGRSATHPSLLWLRLPHRGKARALNAALLEIETDIVVTLDADTRLDRDALAQFRGAFAADPHLIAAGGVIAPFCAAGIAGRIMQTFQTYEYVRNVIARFAWAQINGLVLISGAFAGFRREALMAVGGFDPESLVEDYELTHRLHRYSVDQGCGWRLGMVGRALARTEAPARLAPFLRQRRRWFAGYLQTQFANIDLVGNPRYGRVGTQMLVIKAFDTLQPMHGLASVIVLLALIASGRTEVLPAIAALIAAKILVDLVSSVWIVALYHRLTGDRSAGRPMPTIAAIVADFLGFMPLRHAGAAWGWIAMLRGRPRWGAHTRATDEPQRSLE